MESIKTVIKKGDFIKKKHLNIFQIVLSDKQKVRIFGDVEYADFKHKLDRYAGKGLIYTKHGIVNPNFIVSISRDLQAERDVYEDFTQYGLPYEPPPADFQLPETSNIDMIGTGNKDD